MHLRPRCEPAVPSVPAVSMTARSASGNDDARMGPDSGLIDLLDMLRHAEPPQAEEEQVVSRRGAVLPPGQPAVGKTVDAKTLRDLLRREEEDAAARRVSILAAPSPPAPHHRIVEKEVRVEVPPPPEAPPSAPPRAAARMPRRHGRNSPAVAAVARCPWR